MVQQALLQVLEPIFEPASGSIQDAKAFCRRFFQWYNAEHHHLGIGLMTPNQVHYRQADEVYEARKQTLEIAWSTNCGSRNRSRTARLENDDPFVPLLIERKAGETQLFVKQVKVEGVRYIVCRNEAEAANRKEREAIVAALDAQLKKGDKLV